MIRVWGGGIYEREMFYRLCDRMGLMVWQDFMYACGEYPEAAWFLREAKKEAETVVRRLRNHPCIVIWCGNNECEWLFCTENPDKTPDDMNGASLFREILRNVCHTLDGTRPYWRSSPFGTGFPNSESNGNHHQWTVWSSWKDYKEYQNDHARFVSEFGFQAPANRPTFEEVTLPSDRHAQSQVMEHHNKQVEGTERLLRFQSAHYRLIDPFDGFIYRGQLVQSDALNFAVEHWRRQKFNTAGSLLWQLNDCWPVSSWAIIDSSLRPKAAYYAARKFFASVLVSFKQVRKGVEVWVTNDLLAPVSGVLMIELRSFDGRTSWKKRLQPEAGPNSSKKMYLVEGSVIAKQDPASHYLHAQLTTDGKNDSENKFFFVEPKHMKLPKAKVTSSLRKITTDTFELKIGSNKYVKSVRVEIEGETIVFSDNYFDIDAGGAKRILFSSGLSPGQLKKRLKLKWL